MKILKKINKNIFYSMIHKFIIDYMMECYKIFIKGISLYSLFMICLKISQKLNMDLIETFKTFFLH